MHVQHVSCVSQERCMCIHDRVHAHVTYHSTALSLLDCTALHCVPLHTRMHYMHMHTCVDRIHTTKPQCWFGNLYRVTFRNFSSEAEPWEINEKYIEDRILCTGKLIFGNYRHQIRNGVVSSEGKIRNPTPLVHEFLNLIAQKNLTQKCTLAYKQAQNTD